MTPAPTPHARPTSDRRSAVLRRHALSILMGTAIVLSAVGTAFTAGTAFATDRNVGQGTPASYVDLRVDEGGPDGVDPGGPVAVRRDTTPDDSIRSALLILAAAGVVASVLGRTGSRRHR